MVIHKAFFIIFKISKESTNTEAHLKSTETEIQISLFIDTPLTFPYALPQSRIQLRICWDLSYCSFIHYARMHGHLSLFACCTIQVFPREVKASYLVQAFCMWSDFQKELSKISLKWDNHHTPSVPPCGAQLTRHHCPTVKTLDLKTDWQ